MEASRPDTLTQHIPSNVYCYSVTPSPATVSLCSALLEASRPDTRTKRPRALFAAVLPTCTTASLGLRRDTCSTPYKCVCVCACVCACVCVCVCVCVCACVLYVCMRACTCVLLACVVSTTYAVLNVCVCALTCVFGASVRSLLCQQFVPLALWGCATLHAAYLVFVCVFY